MTELKDNEVAVSKTTLDSLAKLYKQYLNNYNITSNDPAKYIYDINILVGDLLVYGSLSNIENCKYIVSGSISEEEVKNQMILLEKANKTIEEEVINYGYWLAMKRKNISFYDRAVRDAAKQLNINITTSTRSRYSLFKDKIEYDMVSTRSNYKRFDAWWKEQFKCIDRL